MCWDLVLFRVLPYERHGLGAMRLLLLVWQDSSLCAPVLRNNCFSLLYRIAARSHWMEWHQRKKGWGLSSVTAASRHQLHSSSSSSSNLAAKTTPPVHRGSAQQQQCKQTEHYGQYEYSNITPTPPLTRPCCVLDSSYWTGTINKYYEDHI